MSGSQKSPLVRTELEAAPRTKIRCGADDLPLGGRTRSMSQLQTAGACTHCGENTEQRVGGMSESEESQREDENDEETTTTEGASTISSEIDDAFAQASDRSPQVKQTLEQQPRERSLFSTAIFKKAEKGMQRQAQTSGTYCTSLKTPSESFTSELISRSRHFHCYSHQPAVLYESIWTHDAQMANAQRLWDDQRCGDGATHMSLQMQPVQLLDCSSAAANSNSDNIAVDLSNGDVKKLIADISQRGRAVCKSIALLHPGEHGTGIDHRRPTLNHTSTEILRLVLQAIAQHCKGGIEQMAVQGIYLNEVHVELIATILKQNPKLHVLSLRCTYVTKLKLFQKYPSFQQLRKLDLGENGVIVKYGPTVASIECFCKALPALEQLDLSGDPSAYEANASLNMLLSMLPSLKKLNLGGSRLSFSKHKDAKAVNNPRLTHLSLRASEVTKDDIQQSLQHLRSLTSLDLSRAWKIQEMPYPLTEDELGLLTKLPKLSELDLSDVGTSGTFQLSPESLKCISSCTGLKKLSLKGTMLNDDVLQRITCSMPCLEEINIACTSVSASGIIGLLQRFKSSLVAIDISNTSASPDISPPLSRMQQLKHLHASSCMMDDNIFISCKGTVKLETVDLSSGGLPAGTSFLRSKESLQSLTLMSSSLRFLNLAQRILDQTQVMEAIGSLVHLQFLNLSACSLYGDGNLSCLSRLQALEVLVLSSNGSLETVPAEIGRLRNSLQLLDLTYTAVRSPYQAVSPTALQSWQLQKLMETLQGTYSQSAEEKLLESFAWERNRNVHFLFLSPHASIDDRPGAMQLAAQAGIAQADLRPLLKELDRRKEVVWTPHSAEDATQPELVIIETSFYEHLLERLANPETVALEDENTLQLMDTSKALVHAAALPNLVPGLSDILPAESEYRLLEPLKRLLISRGDAVPLSDGESSSSFLFIYSQLRSQMSVPQNSADKRLMLSLSNRGFPPQELQLSRCSVVFKASSEDGLQLSRFFASLLSCCASYDDALIFVAQNGIFILAGESGNPSVVLLAKPIDNDAQSVRLVICYKENKLEHAAVRCDRLHQLCLNPGQLNGSATAQVEHDACGSYGFEYSEVVQMKKKRASMSCSACESEEAPNVVQVLPSELRRTDSSESKVELQLDKVLNHVQKIDAQMQEFSSSIEGVKDFMLQATDIDCPRYVAIIPQSITDAELPADQQQDDWVRKLENNRGYRNLRGLFFDEPLVLYLISEAVDGLKWPPSHKGYRIKRPRRWLHTLGPLVASMLSFAAQFGNFVAPGAEKACGLLAQVLSHACQSELECFRSKADLQALTRAGKSAMRSFLDSKDGSWRDVVTRVRRQNTLVYVAPAHVDPTIDKVDQEYALASYATSESYETSTYSNHLNLADQLYPYPGEQAASSSTKQTKRSHIAGEPIKKEMNGRDASDAERGSSENDEKEEQSEGDVSHVNSRHHDDAEQSSETLAPSTTGCLSALCLRSSR